MLFLVCQRKQIPPELIGRIAGSLQPVPIFEVSTLARNVGGQHDQHAPGVAMPVSLVITDTDQIYVVISDLFGDAIRRNASVRRIESDGTVTMIAGPIKSMHGGFRDGPGRAARFTSPEGIIMGTNGNLLVADSDNQCIRKIWKSGFVTTLFGVPNSGPGDGGFFEQPCDMAVDAQGHIFVSDFEAHCIKKIDVRTKQISTVAGTGKSLDEDIAKQDVGPALEVCVSYPGCLAFDPQGRLLFSSEQGLRRIDLAENPPTVHYVFADFNIELTSFTVDAEGTIIGCGASPMGVHEDLFEDHSIVILRADGKLANGKLPVLAGDASEGHVDGSAAEARFDSPSCVALDSAGNVIVADAFNNSVRKIACVEYTFSPC